MPKLKITQQLGEIVRKQQAKTAENLTKLQTLGTLLKAKKLEVAREYLEKNMLDASISFEFTEIEKKETSIKYKTTALHLLANAIDLKSYDEHDDEGHYKTYRYTKEDVIYYQNIFLKLLEYGANINAIDNFGDPVIMTAVKTKNNYLLELLLEAGANMDCKDKENNSIFDVARHFDLFNQNEIHHRRIWTILDQYTPRKPYPGVITPQLIEKSTAPSKSLTVEELQAIITSLYLENQQLKKQIAPQTSSNMSKLIS